METPTKLYLLAGNETVVVESPPEVPGKSCRCPRRRKRFVLTWQSSLTPQNSVLPKIWNCLLWEIWSYNNLVSEKIDWKTILSNLFCFGSLPLSFQEVTVISGELSAYQVTIKEMGMKFENSKMKLKKPRPSQQKHLKISSCFFDKRTDSLRYSDFAEGENESLLKEARITTYINQIWLLSQFQW